ncbi:MAG: transcriptional regulator [Dermatophilaceae bacterium]
MSLAGLDPVIHAPKRLSIMAVLAHSSSTDFTFLKQHLGVSDSDLSKQMSALEASGYITVSKSRGRGGTTTYRATRQGRSAFAQHVAALQSIVSDAAASAQPSGGRARPSTD